MAIFVPLQQQQFLYLLHKISRCHIKASADELVSEWKYAQQEASKTEPELKYIFPPGLYNAHDKTPVFSLGSQLYFEDTGKNEEQACEQSPFRLNLPVNYRRENVIMLEVTKNFINFFPGVSEILWGTAWNCKAVPCNT